MTYRELLRDTSVRLAASETPFLDALLLLAESLGAPKEKVLAMLPERAEDVPEAFYRMVERRRRGESVAHILGRREFYGREFLVREGVLSPRPDTEILVEAALGEGDRLQSDGGSLRVLDLCTGSGAVAISVAAERPGWTVAASDISPIALELARDNAERLVPDAPIVFVESDLFARIEGTFDLICSNPPYVPRREASALVAGGWKDPLLALDGGEDGMEFIRAIIERCAEFLSTNGVLLLEMDPSQAESAALLLQRQDFSGTQTWKDLAGRIRVVGAHHG